MTTTMTIHRRVVIRGSRIVWVPSARTSGSTMVHRLRSGLGWVGLDGEPGAGGGACILLSEFVVPAPLRRLEQRHVGCECSDPHGAGEPPVIAEQSRKPFAPPPQDGE